MAPEIVIIVMMVLTAMFVTSQFMFRNTKKEAEEQLPGYDKFLEDSREEAFKYIEEVQQGVREFVQEVQPLAEQYSKENSKDTKAKHIQAMKKVKENTEKLKSVLPEDE